jgi:hypothetical protein
LLVGIPLPAKSFFKEAKKKTPFQSVVLQLWKLHQDSRLLLSPELSPANAHSIGGSNLSYYKFFAL